ncbi:elongation factor P 5-aminopentanone reductase [Rummeliibacillus suwonensis]|uniref:elongation factor P 5-aminopentanone reductase n=1 Tax=Rummeliibacillus suwonensis TaxID=1306154 RepID=UPI001AAEBDB9|nr:SDR family oxidoreductase [Rummeliibacillus suwonensis]MBO2534638.1 SDR family oxidoreductase [Rummeliibacillus suwonensis]
MKKFALVLGASGAIGSAVCRGLAENGWSLYMHYNHHTDVIQNLIKELSQTYPEQEFMTIHADLTADSAATTIAQSVFSIEAIVVASGQALYKLVEDTTVEEMTALWKVHVQTPIQMIALLAPKLRQHPVSYITMIGSIWGEAGGAGETLYSTVKGAIHAFVKAYAKEVSFNGTRVNAVAPGLIDTSMNSHLNETEMADLLAEIPLERAGTPEEVAHLVSFLHSGKANYITGQILRINGGWYI